MLQIAENMINIFTSPNFYVPVILCILLIALGNIFQLSVQKKMKTPLLQLSEVTVDWWSISHVILYVYFGYHFPDYFIEFLILGAIWEIFENIFCKESFQKIIGCTKSNSLFCRTMNQLKTCDYWYGKFDDIAMNMLGFVVGVLLRKYAS